MGLRMWECARKKKRLKGPFAFVDVEVDFSTVTVSTKYCFFSF